MCDVGEKELVCLSVGMFDYLFDWKQSDCLIDHGTTWQTRTRCEAFISGIKVCMCGSGLTIHGKPGLTQR